MKSDNPQKMEVGQLDKNGEYAQVADGNFVTVQPSDFAPAPKTADVLSQVISQLARQNIAPQGNANTPAPAPKADSGVSGKTATAADVDAAKDAKAAKDGK